MTFRAFALGTALSAVLLSATAGAAATGATAATAGSESCRPIGAYRITGYVRTEFSARTYDGTSIYTEEHIAAGSWNLPLNTRVRVEGLDFTYRIADRGALEPKHLDIAVWSREEAYAIESYVGGKYAQVCIVDDEDESSE
jgi:3D (Asp-Asp-Asp) domain-containing protein